MKRILVFLGLALLLAVTLLPTLSFCANPNPRVLPPNSTLYGMSYGEWSARWFQWAASMPLDDHPLADTADCSRGQLGPVWFLGGSFTVSNVVIRNCRVPAGKALFFPIVNVDCSSLEQPPFFGDTPGARRTCATEIIDTVTDLSAEVDGEALHHLRLYRATSPNLVFAVPPDNVLGVAADSGEMVADGYYLMLEPLPVGRHTIHFSGTIGVFNFTLDITYHLTVRP